MGQVVRGNDRVERGDLLLVDIVPQDIPGARGEGAHDQIHLVELDQLSGLGQRLRGGTLIILGDHLDVAPGGLVPYLAERQWDDALAVVKHFEKSDKVYASYLRALVYLKKGETDRAAPEVAVLQQAYQNKKNDRRLEWRLWETQGLLLCQQPGGAGPGLKLLAKLVEKTKDDYSHHAWGNGSSYMEEWGIAALQAGKNDVAEEAFLEALAHDAGSARGALGLQVLCERQNRSEEAVRYAELARRFWRRAAPQALENELAAMRRVYPQPTATVLNH